MALLRKVILTFVVSLLWAGQLAAQTGSVSGRVTDATTTGAVAGAGVEIEGTQYRTATGSDGAFVLSNVPAGTHKVTVRFIGYAPVTQQVTVNPRQTTTVEFFRPLQGGGAVVQVVSEENVREHGRFPAPHNP